MKLQTEIRSESRRDTDELARDVANRLHVPDHAARVIYIRARVDWDDDSIWDYATTWEYIVEVEI